MSSFTLLALLAAPLLGDLNLTTHSEQDAHVVKLSATWKNGWRNARNHDALWVVVRDANDVGSAPLRLAAEGHVVRGTPAARVVPAPDGTGAFIEPTEEHRGPVDWTVALRLADSVLRMGGDCDVGDLRRRTVGSTPPAATSATANVAHRS